MTTVVKLYLTLLSLKLTVFAVEKWDAVGTTIVSFLGGNLGLFSGALALSVKGVS